jgi:hypothetical protein
MTDWAPYIPTDQDVQHSNIADFLACGPFSAIHIKEMVDKKNTGKEHDDSERALAKLTPVTKKGSSLSDVVDAINNHGFISVNDWPELVDTNSNVTWDMFYADIPPEVLAKADKSWKATLRKLNPNEVPQALDSAPVWTIINRGGMNHIVAQINQTQYFDSYRYFIKDFQPGEIQSQWQLLLTQKQSMHLAQDNGTVYLVAGVNNKVKIGIADTESLALFGDEPIQHEDTSAIAETKTLTTGFSIHNK